MRLKCFSNLAGADFDRFLTSFSKLQEGVRQAPYRTGLLPFPVWIGFICQPTKFAKEFWIVEDDLGRALGRIGANVSATKADEGAIGFFECDLTTPAGIEAGGKLLEAAESWLKAKGVKTAYGPMNFNTWFPYRFRTSQNIDKQDLFFGWEPVNPPEYVDIWKSAGYETCELYATKAHGELDAFAAKTKPAYDGALAAGYTFRTVEPIQFLEKDVPVLYEISSQGFKDNFLFEPIPFEVFRALYVPIAGKSDLSLSHIAFDKDGKGVGFFFCYEDQGHLVLKSTAVVPQARGKGISNAVAYLAAEKALKKGVNKYITALVKTGAQSESFAKKGSLLWEHEYTLFSKLL